MFYRNKKTRKYQAPVALATHMVLESNFCQTVRFNVQVKELENMNDPESDSYDASEAFYFES
jgi:hypothetical protein